MNKERNPVGWFEIYVSDMDRAKKFYETMLDVTLEPLPSPDASVEMVAFPMLAPDDCGGEAPGAPGALAKMEGMSPGGSGTLVYFSCLDCADDESRVATAGGQVIKPKFSIGEYGFISLVMDTEGNMVGLHSTS
ncbi:glyoxalase [Oceaniferula spumae]|uniref:Glyoxalase n=1 Tax=Oceaniferula spumae TaxID=2979115 RepID=A0AAT9FIE2_9BACT